jgi:hypothetical protein
MDWTLASLVPSTGCRARARTDQGSSASGRMGGPWPLWCRGRDRTDQGSSAFGRMGGPWPLWCRGRDRTDQGPRLWVYGRPWLSRFAQLPGIRWVPRLGGHKSQEPRTCDDLVECARVRTPATSGSVRRRSRRPASSGPAVRQLDAVDGIEPTKVQPPMVVWVDLGHFGAVDGIELTKVHPPLDVWVDLGHFDAVGGIELTKVHPPLDVRVDLGFQDLSNSLGVVGFGGSEATSPGNLR